MPNGFDAEKRKQVADLKRRLARNPEGKRAGEFAAILFEHAAGEDLIEYGAEALADIARTAFAFFTARSTPVAIRIADLPELDGKGRTHTAIEISTADRPFIFDSVLGELQAAGHPVRLVLHPVLDVRRDDDGAVLEFARAGLKPSDGMRRESFVHVHVPCIAAEPERQALAQRLATLLDEVRLVTGDFAAMRARLADAIGEFQSSHPDLPDGEADETIAFLQWLDGGNFIFLGMRDISYAQFDEAGAQEPGLEGAAAEGLGLLRDPSVKILGRGAHLVTMTPALRAFLAAPDPLIVTKANVKSRVHRRDYMDLVGIKRFEGARAVGELRVVGLFASEAFTQSVRDIPLLRRKVVEIMARAGFDPLGHSGKTLLNVLEHYPRTELFQANPGELFDAALAVLQLEERPRVRVLARRDRFDRFVSVLVFVPRDRYSSDLRERIGAALAEMYDGRVSAYFPDFSATHLTRVQFIIGRNAGEGPDPAQGDVEARVRAIVRSFEDQLGEALGAAFDPEQAGSLAARYAGCFGSDYQAAFTAADALADIAVAESLGPEGAEAHFSRPEGTPEGEVRLRFHRLGSPAPLSARVPLLENFGFSVIDERTFEIAARNAPTLFVHDMLLAVHEGGQFDARVAERLRQALLAVWRGDAEQDGFNALVLLAGLSWREAALLRTLARYLRQNSLPYSLDYLWGALQRNPQAAKLLMARFAARFSPAKGNRERAEDKAASAVDAALDAVHSLDDDTILRALDSLIAATVRTDFYAESPGQPASTIAIKLDPGRLAFVPAPRPYREIFVHSPEVDGLHMRFGAVARGGLRWSDRPQDFRTEVLGLAKAQQVKNAVIVPVGAKGGFVPKRLPAASGPGGREAVFEAGRLAYIRFVDRLLALTDDIEGDVIVPPAGLVRHDGDDPYLVVAADKGTATFSDTANAISLERGFWLGDAFASGGSAGYDHKAMGITARGAWEAVKRHFREMDVDIQTQPFTVAGVGDMSGDVFGNGMLLSPEIRLVAAFDHRDIFIDPDPDPARTLAERRRLFGLPRSSWQDFDPKLLSKGGGVYSRAAKEIALSPEARRLLHLRKSAMPPAELIAAILKAPVDLLWFGGIGTYVRAPDESAADVGDKANDAIRISADEVGAKVVGEGANLAMTAKARIAYSLRGGRCNSDAIDNSAGVNTSDLEVNIKIALAPAVREGRLPEEARLRLLGAMTDDVAALVLRNNYGQTLAISLEERRGPEHLDDQLRLAHELEARGLLDRKVESLPGDAELKARAAGGKGLTRPEIGTLLAFAKIGLRQDLVGSAVPDDPYLARELFRYFPGRMREEFAAGIDAHRLRREIIATQLANSLVNRGGPTLLVTVRDRTGAGPAELTRAYAAVRDAFSLQELHAEIDALDGNVPGQLQLDLYALVQGVLVDRLAWFTRNLDPAADLAEMVAQYRGALEELAGILPGLAPRASGKAGRDFAAKLTTAGVPQELAARLALLPKLAHAIDIVPIARTAGRPLPDAAAAYFAIDSRFGFGEVEAMADAVPNGDHYETLALQKARDGLEAAHRDLACSMLRSGRVSADVEKWDGFGGARPDATAAQVQAILADKRPTVAKVSVAASLLAELARG